MLHHNIHTTKSPQETAVHIDTLSRRFSEMRDKTSLIWTGKNEPTFREQRSLSERLYKEQGVDTRLLLGHKDEKTTTTYVAQIGW